jgi:DNA (cytosine-5)-methyltransferase 1
MKILNLYSGIGGNRKLWGNEHEITAVEYNPEIAQVYKDNFPNDTVIVSDAHQYLLDHYKEFDFIWASPPCPTHSKMVKATRHDINVYPDMKLYQEIIFLQHFFRGKWIVENVIPYYQPLIPAKKVGRHLFWANFRIGNIDINNIEGFIQSGESNKDLQVIKDRLGIQFEKNIYINGNHSPGQVLRNCVLPEVGEYILNCALSIIKKSNVNQLELL